MSGTRGGSSLGLCALDQHMVSTSDIQNSRLPPVLASIFHRSDQTRLINAVAGSVPRGLMKKKIGEHPGHYKDVLKMVPAFPEDGFSAPSPENLSGPSRYPLILEWRASRISILDSTCCVYEEAFGSYTAVFVQAPERPVGTQGT